MSALLGLDGCSALKVPTQQRVAEVVRRHDPAFAAFSARLAAAGKPKKVIRADLAHKLLTRLNAKARDVRNEFALAA